MTTPARSRGRPPGPVDPNAPPSAYKRYNRSRPMKWWHEAIIDDMLLYPLDDYQKRADRLGYSKQTVMMLANSDMFKAAYEERRANLREKLDSAIAQQMAEVANLGLTVMKESLEKKRTSIPFKDLAAANDSMLERLGYGLQSASAAVQVNVTNNSAITPELLAAARAKLRDNEQARAGETRLPGPSGPMLDITPAPLPGPTTPAPQDVDAARNTIENSSD